MDIDDPILRELKARARQEGKSLGRMASDLLALALGGEDASAGKDSPFAWISKAMGARVDLSDPEAVYSAMEEALGEQLRVAEDS